MKTEKIDVIIPTYHPGKEFAALLECLEQQSCPVSRIIVMNTEEQFWDIKWEKEHPCLEVHHLKKENFDHGGTRRQAAELSDGDVMVFLTQDAMPADKNTVSHLVKALNSQENIGAAYARQLPNSSCSFVEAYTRSFNYPDQSGVKTKDDLPVLGIKTFFCSNVCAAYKKDIYRKLGGFVEKTIFNEDMRQTLFMPDMELHMLRMQKLFILIIIPAASSFTGTLTWEFPRLNIRKFLMEFHLREKDSAW